MNERETQKKKRQVKLAIILAALVLLLLQIFVISPFWRKGAAAGPIAMAGTDRKAQVNKAISPPAIGTSSQDSDNGAAVATNDSASVPEMPTSNPTNKPAPGEYRTGEVVILFTDAASYARFIVDAPGPRLLVTGQLPELLAVRAEVMDGDLLWSDLQAAGDPAADVDYNWTMPLATAPGSVYVNDTTFTGWGYAGWGYGGLGYFPGWGYSGYAELGVTMGDPHWGEGQTIAFLDTGILAGISGNEPPGSIAKEFAAKWPWWASRVAAWGQTVGQLDAGWGLNPNTDLGGTWRAFISTQGSIPAYNGVAPGAKVLGVRVTDDDGVSDVFSVAAGIVRSASAGANFIEISPSSPHPCDILSRAIDYADEFGVTLVAASPGDVPAWPADDARVIAIASLIAPIITYADGSTGADWAAGYPWIADQFGIRRNGAYSSIPMSSAGIVTGMLASIRSVRPELSGAEEWDLLQQTSVDAAIQFANSNLDGYQVFNLNWLEWLPEASAGTDTYAANSVVPQTGGGGFRPQFNFGGTGLAPSGSAVTGSSSLSSPRATDPGFLPGTSSGRSGVILRPGPNGRGGRAGRGGRGNIINGPRPRARGNTLPQQRTPQNGVNFVPQDNLTPAFGGTAQ